MENNRRVLIASFVIMAVAVIGFFIGTNRSDYDLETPLTQWEAWSGAALPAAPSYTDERSSGGDPDTEVVSSCADCHEDRIDNSRSGHRLEHPINVPLPAGADITALTAAGARMDKTQDGRPVVICRSCHRPHNPGQPSRLVMETAEGKLCVSCHADHRSGRSLHPVSGSIDASLRGAVQALGGSSDAGLECLSCHSPHKAVSDPLLRTLSAGTNSCRSCHTSEVAALNNGHGGQTCESCHGMHARPSHTTSTIKAGDPEDQYCVNCHVGNGGSNEKINVKAGHPMWRPFTTSMQQNGHSGTVGCTDCHSPHGNSDNLLTLSTVAETCLSCHPSKDTVVGTKHDAAVVAVAGEGNTCLSCHAVHGGSAVPKVPAGVNPASGVCLSCHDGRTNARAVTEYQHPAGVLLTVDGLPFRYTGSVPYFGPNGQRTSDHSIGEITCQTCHDVHVWQHDANAHPGTAEGNEQNSFLRDPNQVAAFCTVCHGVDGLAQFRYFHSTTYRKEQAGKP